MEKPYKSLGLFLKEARLKKNLSQLDVATKLGYTTPQFVSNLERGIASPPCRNLRTLIDILDLNPSQFIEIMYREEQKQLKASIEKLRKTIR